MTTPDLSLSEIRARLDVIDEDVTRLLAARQPLVLAAARLKTSPAAVHAADRQEQVLRTRREAARRHGLDPDVAAQVYRAVMDAFIALEQRAYAAIDPSTRG